MTFNGSGTNGLGWKIAGGLLGIVLTLFSWNATRELDKTDARLEKLEEKRGTIEFLDRSRDEDRKLLEEIRAEQKEVRAEMAKQGRLLSAVAERMNVGEK